VYVTNNAVICLESFTGTEKETAENVHRYYVMWNA